MKQNRLIIRFLALAFSAAAILPACREERSGEPEKTVRRTTQTVLFHACEVQTKTVFGDGQDGTYPTLWTANDASVKLALNFTEAAEAGVVPDEGGRTATFVADIDASGTSAPYTFYAVSPASAARALSPSREAWSISIPSVQTPLDGSVDESALILAAASTPSDAVPSSVDLHFNHLTAYGRISFKNLALGDANVERVEMTATTPFVGDWYWDCAEGHALTDNGASSTLTLQTSRTSDIWFACAPVDMSGEIMVVTVYTDQGAFVKEIEFPSGRKFQAGRVAVFTVNMEGISLEGITSEEFRLVTSTSSLAAGDEILIINKAGTYGLGSHIPASSNRAYRSAAVVTVSGNQVTDRGEAEILTLSAGSSSGTWSISSADGYLCSLASGNSLSVKSSVDSYASWSISIDSDGEATIVAQAGNSNKILYNYNNGSPRFSCYGPSTSVDGPVAIYRKAGSSSSATPEDPLAANTEFGFYQGSTVRTYVPGQDQYSRQYNGDGVQTFAIIDPANNEQLEIRGYRRSLVKGDDLTITVYWKVGASKVVNGTTYQVSVVKEEGPVVWLGNGSGNGFIIKK